MQIAKKYFSESLIQLTILLSLVGVRVDIDSYLTGYYSPLAEINLGPSSAYIQTPFHVLRDTLDGNGVHPKCPELDYFFASRRLLDEVRSLGSPRFPTQLNAWLVHQVSATDKAEHGPSTSENSDSSHELEDPGYEAGDGREHLPVQGQEVDHTSPELGQGPCGAGAFLFPQEVDEAKVKEEEDAVPITQLAHSSTLEQEYLLESNPTLSGVEHHYAPPTSTDVDWSNLLSVTDLDELDSIVNEHLSELSADITSAISHDVSLHDATVTSAGAFGVGSGVSESRIVTQQRRPLLRLESTNSTLSDVLPGMAVGLAALPFASVCNLTGNVTSQSLLGGCLDEAVFDQINQLGLEGLDTIDNQLMNSLGRVDSQGHEDLDSDSGLSLESSYGGPASPGSSEISSSSSYCEDEGGATGYNSDVDSLPSKGIMDHTTMWPPVDLRENVWHDHSYSSPAFLNKASLKLPQKTEEAFSDDDDDDDGSQLEEEELSRDELRARAMYIPFSVRQIVSMPVEEFMEILDCHGFSPEQVTLLRDIRRRGKNKLAAQNCRKRKLDAITGLQEEVERLQAQRDRLLREKQLTAKTMGAVGHQIKQLTRDVLARLRDDSGRPLSPERFTLQCGANGRVVIQPLRRPAVSTSAGNKTDKRKKGKKQ
ncbi:nuclear factor erythroid 2-related factor 3 [Nematolebias whitei]|uniref:nuclear factor erythroid 2-related factor 3 n=1 Tax=Nematolebias whitei TaxID=451745 RepID=UPI001899FA1D|nr:nuclear factor erythroid 2-related factor 3 [Nematolebias whitei]